MTLVCVKFKKKSNQYSSLFLKWFHKVEMLKNIGADLREARARTGNEYDQNMSYKVLKKSVKVAYILRLFY